MLSNTLHSLVFIPFLSLGCTDCKNCDGHFYHENNTNTEACVHLSVCVGFYKFIL